MAEVERPVPITIRPAIPSDADGIAQVFLESAEYHASLDPERYILPDPNSVSIRYRERQQHDDGGGMTLVAELNGEVVGFVDARLDQSPDPMHRQLTYCDISEIAVSRRHQQQGIGQRLLQAAEDWGRGEGAEFACLEYHTANTRAGSFYHQRMGYRLAAKTAIKRL